MSNLVFSLGITFPNTSCFVILNPYVPGLCIFVMVVILSATLVFEIYPSVLVSSTTLYVAVTPFIFSGKFSHVYVQLFAVFNVTGFVTSVSSYFTKLPSFFTCNSICTEPGLILSALSLSSHSFLIVIGIVPCLFTILNVNLLPFHVAFAFSLDPSVIVTSNSPVYSLSAFNVNTASPLVPFK